MIHLDMSLNFVCKILLLACVLVVDAARADTESDVNEFIRLRDVVSGSEEQRELHGIHLDKNINSMIALINGGNIPIEVQGEITPKYLEAIVSDCMNKDTCNLDDDLNRLERLKKLKTSIPSNLQTYLDSCLSRILNKCASTVHQQTSDKLSALDQISWNALEKFALRMESELEPKNGPYLYRKGRLWSEIDYHKIVLVALKDLYPTSADNLTKIFINKRKHLRTFMDNIRRPCVSFLENLDPTVQFYPVGPYNRRKQDPIGQIQAWNFLGQSCERVISQWKDLVKEAQRDNIEFLADPKPESITWWVRYGEIHGKDSGITLSDLKELSRVYMQDKH